MKSSSRSDTSKWLATVASIWIQCTCGASYAFGIYSPVLKSTQGYHQSTLDTVSVFKDIGANAGILSGMLYAAVTARGGNTHPRRGPWLVHAAGVVQCFVGYFFMWLAVTGAIPRPPVGVMCLFMFLGAHAQTFFNTANVVTAVHNFPQYNGTVVGIMKGFLGLSGAVLVQVYYTFFRGKQTTFLLILALLPSILTVLLMFLVKINDTPTRDVKKHLNSFSWVSIIIASYLTFLIIMEDVITLPRLVQMCLLVVLFLLLSSPLGIAIRAQKQDSQRLLASSSTTPLLNDYVASADTEKLLATDGGMNRSTTISDGVSSEDLLALEKDMNVIQAIRSMNFWLLFVAMMFGMGSGLATINNISQIGESLGYTMAETSALVSLWSIWNFLGRFMAGFMSDVLLHKQGWPRPIFICGTLVTMSIGHIVIASGFPGNLYVGSVLVGISYGAQWSLMPTITSDIFGVKNMGTIFNTIAVASPVGSYMFSVQAIGEIYDRETSGQDNACYGTHCFMLSFFILASVSLCGSLVALVLFFNTKSYYTRVVIRRLRHAAKQ
ncbi:hypothetical protein Leryth_026254 [Lithospermum erythrorhizon]|nr:hypothetical protein Leryth_026254 [Lithospermum erythrorhizon]